jgi:hypothetical protein
MKLERGNKAMPGVNFDDVDFDLNNLRAEEDMWNRQVATHNNRFNTQENFGIPLDGDKLIENAKGEKATKTVLDMYNELGRK